jgi:energy-coupling factor transporter ATP-binding protein EcfA2
VGDLYGRGETIQRVAARVRGAATGEGALILLTGEPGIGKSRLAEHLAELAAATGTQVVWGRCWEAGGAPAYWPWIQIFRALEMDEDPFAVPVDLGGTAEQARFQVFDLAVRKLRERAARAPIAVVLDDLHAADLPSLLLLMFLARSLRGSRMLVIATSRDAEARLVPEAAALLAKIAREGEVLALSRLAAPDVEAWVRAALPSATADQAAVLFRVTEGHPLFITEMLRLGPREDARDRLLEGLGATLDERLLVLSAETRAVLEVAAVLGREFSLTEVAALAERSPDEAERCLREARAAGVVTAGPAAGTFLFSHVLRRDRIYTELLPSRRAALHWKAGLGRLARGEDPSAAVHHLLQGHTAGDGARAAEVALAVAEAALARFAFEEAARLVHQALPLLPVATGLHCQLTLVLAEALIPVGQGVEGRALAVKAADAARQLKDAELLARAALAYAAQQTAGAVDGTMVALLREALAALDQADSLVRARLTARLGAALMPPKGLQDYLYNVGLSREATAMARRLGDPHTLLYSLQNYCNGAGFIMPLDERAALFEEIVALAGTLGQRMVLLNSLAAHATMLVARGQRAGANLALDRLEQLLAVLPQTHQQWRLPLARALFAGLDGDFAEADRLNEEARVLAVRPGSGYAVSAWTFQQLSLADLRGDPGMLVKHAPALLTTLSMFAAKVSPATVLAVSGQRDEAQRLLRDATFDPGDVTSLVFGALACLTLEDTEVAERLYAPVAALANTHRLFLGTAAASIFGPLARMAGELARLAGRPTDATRHHDQALAVCAAVGSPALTALCERARSRAAPGSAPVPRSQAAAPPRIDLRREGEFWALAHAGQPAIRLKHSKGLGYLQYLLDQPGRETHVLELVGTEHVPGDAGPVLDARAKTAYRQRLDDLRDELAEADRFGDRGRVARAQEEIETIAEQLAGAVGLGGRDRRAASDVERARVNVQRRLKDTVDRIAAVDAGLGRYLAAAIKTGTYCSYTPV